MASASSSSSSQELISCLFGVGLGVIVVESIKNGVCELTGTVSVVDRKLGVFGFGFLVLGLVNR